jgi:hypothetical protein
MQPREFAVQKMIQELRDLYRKNTGKQADPEILRAEAESLVEKYGPTAELKDIFLEWVFDK